MIGKRDERRKEEALKKAEQEKKKKEKEAVREVCVSPSSLLAKLGLLSLHVRLTLEISVPRCRPHYSLSTTLLWSL